MQHLTPVDRCDGVSYLEADFECTEACSRPSALHLNGAVATLLSALTSNYSNQRINNSKHLILQFLNEVVKRSKSTQNVVLQATYLFHQIYTRYLKAMNKSITEMPEFARCSKRVFLSCLILAHKFNNDSTFSMKTWCLISGLKASVLAKMERWSLSILDYNLRIKDETLLKWYNCVLKESLIQNPLVDTPVALSLSCRKRSISDLEEQEQPYLDTSHKLRNMAHTAAR